MSAPLQADGAGRPADRDTAKRAAEAAIARRFDARARIDTAAEARHARVVRMLKFALPLIAGVIVVVVLAYSALMGGEGRFTVTYEEPGGNAGELKMLNPSLKGVDDGNHPFTVTAEWALQDPADPKRMTLHGIEADITLENATWVNLKASDGLLDGTAETLTLTGDISLFTDSGYEFHTEAANVDLKGGRVWGSVPVRSQGPLGLIEAQGFEFLRTSREMRFTGGVRSIFHPAARGG